MNIISKLALIGEIPILIKALKGILYFLNFAGFSLINVGYLKICY